MIRPLAVLLAAFAILAQPARADDYPTRPVRLIVGFAAGSSGDVIARIVAHKLSELLKQNVVVEDKPGASSMVATDYVARSAKDGYTLMFATIATTINMTLLAGNAPNAKRPKMIAVQVEGCQPVVRAFERGEARSQFWDNATTVAAGLRVHKPLGDFLILEAVRASGGTALAVSDPELLDAGIQLAREEGIFAAPEGAACVAALEKLLASGFLKPAERIVIYNTGAGLKYLEAYATRFPRTGSGEQDKLGGLITPR